MSKVIKSTLTQRIVIDFKQVNKHLNGRKDIN